MPRSLLLDSVAAIAILNDKLTLPADTRLNLPIIALGELLAGAAQSTHVDQNRDRVNRFAASCTLLLCDEDTAHHYALIVTELRKKGRPIPQNDMWIAAIALQYDLDLLTRDAHFKEVSNLRIQGW